MGENSNIAWTDNTWNPWRGCTKYGPGCDACYAAARDVRYEGGAHWGKGAPRVRASVHTLNMPYRWEKKAVAIGTQPRVFCLSLGDFFDDEVEPGWRHDAWRTIKETPHLRWQIVTKRGHNIRAMLPVDDMRDGFGHVGFLITVVTPKEADRDVPTLVALKAEHHFSWIGLSVEPQLESIRLPRPWLINLDWVISGGESLQPGHAPRTYDLAWPRALRDQCRAEGVAYFQKQLGACPLSHDPEEDKRLALLRDSRAGADMSEWPDDLRVQQFPQALV